MQTGAVKCFVLLCRLSSIAVLLASVSRSAQAQTDDPVARAMARIQAIVDVRAAAAERIRAASQLVNEGVEASKLGKSGEAHGALRRAELMITTSTPAERGPLVEELLRRIVSEQAKPSSSLPESEPKPGWPQLRSTGHLSRLVLARYNLYRDRLVRILIEEKMPIEVLSVALVESAFNPLAISPKGASGIWQLMPATARRYGLVVEPANDHRSNPEQATRAAARYLQDLHRMFGDWELALAGYNAGEGRVQRAIERAGVRDFSELTRRKLLPLETRNYVPAVLAAWSKMNLELTGTNKAAR